MDNTPTLLPKALREGLAAHLVGGGFVLFLLAAVVMVLGSANAQGDARLVRQQQWAGIVDAQPIVDQAKVARYLAAEAMAGWCPDPTGRKADTRHNPFSWDQQVHERDLIAMEAQCLERLEEQLVVRSDDGREALAMIEAGIDLTP